VIQSTGEEKEIVPTKEKGITSSVPNIPDFVVGDICKCSCRWNAAWKAWRIAG
jgi:hypothetical protein